MLETDEVDFDYFTPAESTSLASIFSKNSQEDEVKDNTSLKYVPMPPPSSKTEEVKPTKWIFTCSVNGFEWSTSGHYINRGKLGLAILKVIKTNSHSIILYDTNKSTVSFTTISSKLKIHKRDDLNVSFYDNTQKCWNIQTSSDNMNKMLQLLQDLNTTVVYKSLVSDREQVDNTKEDNEDKADSVSEMQNDDKETDTDTYMNQKTKESILKRMAYMGHSVLPPQGISKTQASDSSDSDDIDENKKNIRNKPARNISKKCKDLSLQEPQSSFDSHSSKKNKSHADEQLVSIKNCDTLNTSDMNIFISEQKMSNSELRINVNRLSDKIDLVLERLSDVSNIKKGDSSSTFQNEIVQKLIKEYEGKINCYEDFMSSKGIDCQSIKPSDGSFVNVSNNRNSQDNDTHKSRIEQLEKECSEKETLIASFRAEINALNKKNIELVENNKIDIEALLKKIENLNHELHVKNDEIISITKKLGKTSIIDQEDTASKVKKIMNNTFQAISINFNDEDTYTGESLKAIIASVIKKTTIEGLKEL